MGVPPVSEWAGALSVMAPTRMRAATSNAAAASRLAIHRTAGPVGGPIGEAAEEAAYREDEPAGLGEKGDHFHPRFLLRLGVVACDECNIGDEVRSVVDR